MESWTRWVVVVGAMAACGPGPAVTATTGTSESSGSTIDPPSTTSTDSLDPDTSTSTESSSSSGTTEGPTTITDSTDDTSSTSTDGTSSMSTDGTSSTSTDGTSSTDGSSSMATSDSESSSGVETQTESSTTSDTAGNGANGEQCQDDDECASDACYVLGPLGGLCGECLVDADCPGGGCTIPDILAEPPQGAVCNDGGTGEGCQSDAACSGGLVCAEIFSLPGILDNTTCGDCVTDAECADAEVCTPHYDVTNLGGAWACVGAGSDPDGAGCDLDAGGESCASGICAAADFLGLALLGVCSECGVDADCAGNEDCVAPTVDVDVGAIAGYCE